jgi:hypothetical protein
VDVKAALTGRLECPQWTAQALALTSRKMTAIQRATIANPRWAA